jgi:CrcB protein
MVVAERETDRGKQMENMNSTSGLMSFALLLVGLGGAIGSMARFAIGNWLGPWLAPGNFNLSTTAVNVVGSFLLGCLAANFPDRSKSLYMLFGVGFCGGFTTFSTFSLELLEAFLKGNPMSGVLHGLANVFLGLAAVFLGFVLFRAA